ncbi:hypothetical protein CFC21_023637 [Triticum aestivum]|uniref:Myb-like domain-containing protein n=3 Tax=Triticum TaxID=4564 RepID=A0A9R1PPQ3_TRITD|nr:trihelix transcription factor ASR3-like isoform X1 [Triticum dicoccoides]XP_044324277.1 trihelix transcription factor ASR3-like isoform X1 [Triticum aestivum]KAF7009003.1 hypothetical protein CFC21_023637 [Triticum aestivum]VAH47403.1 unnamed protein product [Triticum turgidum subsp. durum]
MSSAGDPGGGIAGPGRAARLPRWTRQEILVLIEGKRVVEVRGRGRGRGAAGGAAAEPTKWAAVAEYCRRHGVERGPVQCRKRWSNLAGDYKKIREWERSLPSLAGKEVSFWAMRNDARRERRLPGFFDREVYDIIEGRGSGGGGIRDSGSNAAVALAETGEEEGKEKLVFDSGRASAAGDDGLFSSSSSSEEEDEETSTPAPAPAPAPVPVLPAAPYPPPSQVPTVVAVAVPVPVPEKKTEAPTQGSSEQAGTSKGKQQEEIRITDEPPLPQGGQKRQRSDDAPGETADLQGKLVEILDRSSRMVAAQLEAQNINCQLDREQRKDQVSSLLGVLGKVADALYRIADKL